MKIARENRFGEITPRHWSEFATDASIDPEGLIERVAQLADAIPDTMRDVLAHLGPVADELRDRLLIPLDINCRSAAPGVHWTQAPARSGLPARAALPASVQDPRVHPAPATTG